MIDEDASFFPHVATSFGRDIQYQNTLALFR